MNEEILAALYPPFAAKVRTVLLASDTSGLPPYEVFMGMRTWPKQDMLYALGRTVKNPDGACDAKPLGDIVTRAKGGDSWHNYGLAVDIIFRPKGQWSWAKDLPWDKLGRMAEGLGLQWGNSMGIDNMETWDRPHYQMQGRLTIVKAKELYLKGGLPEVWHNV